MRERGVAPFALHAMPRHAIRFSDGYSTICNEVIMDFGEKEEGEREALTHSQLCVRKHHHLKGERDGMS